MNQVQYFPKYYKLDLETYSKVAKSDLLENGPFGMLCGRTALYILGPIYRNKYHSLSDFMCCLYCMNLIGQALHSYIPEYYWRWASTSEPYLDCRSCTSHHGYFTGPPRAILQTAKNPVHVSGAEPVVIPSEQITRYLRYFFTKYILETISLGLVDASKVTTMLERLRHDTDCSEITQFINASNVSGFDT